MPEPFWLIMHLLCDELFDHFPQWAERLIHWTCRALPEHKRDRQLRRWLGDLDTVPGRLHKLGFALSLLLAGYRMRARPLRDSAAPGWWRGRRVAQLLLALGRTNAVLVLLAAGLLDVLALASPTSSSGSAALWLSGAGLVFAALVFRGGWIDVPWLRTTRAGAVVQLSVVVGPFVYLYTGWPFPPGLMVIWLSLLFLLPTWELYWENVRPLPRVGLLSKRA